MASKAASGQTKKYSNVVKSVKGDQGPQEPLITKDQVIAAFRSFGFQPNERNHNDIGYWTMKPQSEGQKLMEELHKRRMDINKAEDDKKKTADERQKATEDVLHQQHLDKTAMPRLSDQDIAALFDEYGLPAPDPEWARNHLPNDPKKIRSILEMQRKMADDLLKKHTKNAVNSVPEVPKSISMGGGGNQMTPSPNMGMGGPSAAGPLDMQNGMMPDQSPATPFFIGESAVVRITNPTNPQASTLWLVDPKKKVLQPFISEEAFQNAFEDPAQAEKSIITISSKELGPGGALEGFTPLQGKQGVGQDGSVNPVEFSPAELQNKYGQPQDTNAENKSLSILDGVMGNLSGQQQGIQPPQPVEQPSGPAMPIQ